MKQLTTKIDKQFLGRLCADAISNLERVVEKKPDFPSFFNDPRTDVDVAQSMMYSCKRLNASGKGYVNTIAAEQEWELIIAVQQGMKRMAYAELVDLMTVWLRVGLHLGDYVAKTEAGKVCPVDEENCDRKCVNGNCSIRATCGRYHQAANIFEAQGADGLYDRHSCRKGKCDHHLAKEVQP